MSLDMALLCPICKSVSQEVPDTGDATGYACPTHGNFKVADTIVPDDYLEPEVAQGAAQIVLNGNALRLQQLAVDQQHPQFLAA
jgi:hypothetical protein